MASEILKARIRWGLALAVATGLALGAVLSERIEERIATRTEERASVRAQQPPIPTTFSSSWETCTGVTDGCVRDISGGNWDSWPRGIMLEVVEGGTGAHPPAVNGSNILAIMHDGFGNTWTELKEDLLDITAPDNYIRWYVYIPSTSNLGGCTPHWFQNNSPTRGTTNTFLRYPGPNTAQIITGWYYNSGDGACGIRRINQRGEASEFRMDTNKWYRYEMHIECPNSDACLNVAPGTAVATRINFQIHEVTNIGLGTEVLAADNNNMMVHDYGAGYNSAGWPVADLYDGTVATECAQFDGGDPDFNIGSNGATGCATGLRVGTYVDSFAHSVVDWVGSAFQ